jgi:hypothetical protein
VTTSHEGNAEEENNGYVVFKLNIYLLVNTVGVTSPTPLLSTADSKQMLKDDVNGFSSTSDISKLHAANYRKITSKGDVSTRLIKDILMWPAVKYSKKHLIERGTFFYQYRVFCEKISSYLEN